MFDHVAIDELAIETRARALRAAYVQEMFAMIFARFRASAPAAQAAQG